MTPSSSSDQPWRAGTGGGVTRAITVSTVDPVTPPKVAPIELVPAATAVARPLLSIVAVDGVADAQIT